MNLLLDTHVALWAVEDNPRLSHAARAQLLEPSARLFVSVVSLWEIAIKHAKHGSKQMPMTARDALNFFEASGFVLWPVTPAHVLTLENLPRLHEDPFNRLLLAVAMAEPFRLLTADAALVGYGPMVTAV